MELIHNTKYKFELFDFSKIFRNFSNISKAFWHFGVFVKEILFLNIGFGFCVFNSIWEHRLKIFFDPKSRTI